MEIQERKVADIILLDLSGRIDAFTSEELNSIINTGKRKFIINFDKVTYISSSGLRVFLGAYKKLSDHKGGIRFSNMQDTVLKVFALAGFDKIFDIYSTETEAMNGFKGELNESRA